jgi:diketogulonate reductase-like aldo/keto reductase
VSNFSVKELQEAMYSARKYEIVANQVKYSVLQRQVERDVLPFARRNGIRIIAYTPLEKGFIRAYVLDRLSKKYGKTPIQVALNYLLCQEAIPIPKAVKKEHLEENLGALGWRLDRSDVELIRRET